MRSKFSQHARLVVLTLCVWFICMATHILTSVFKVDVYMTK